MFRQLICVWIFCLSGFSYAAIDTFEFASEEQQARFKHFVDELRCPKCQNQNLSGSNSPIAMDLRKQLYVMIEQGKSDDEIVTYMLDRYGDFILYKPRLTAKTIFLWGAPVFFLLTGLLVLIILLRHKRQLAVQTELSADEQAELNRLLNFDKEKTGGQS
jgi:cytochrome c-type biogenesis protein CcmH